MKISKISLTVMILICVLISYSQKKAVSTQINYMQPYCGGARPSNEMMAESQKPKPYANKTIIIVSQKGKIDSAKTDDNGLLNANLKVGNYKLFEAWKYYKKTMLVGNPVSDFDLACLKTEWKKEIKEITVTKKEIKIVEKNEIVIQCPWKVPCILESHRPPVAQ